METKTIYISGKISGDPFYKDKFKRAKEQLLNDPKVNWIVINPAELPDGFTYEQYMRIDIALLTECDAIFMLRDWHDKNGQMLILEIFSMIYSLLSQQIFTNVGFNDYLGELYMKSNTSNSKAGQFFTPYHVSKLCAGISVDPNIVNECRDTDKILTINEPACGSGGMVLAAADIMYNRHRLNISRNLLVVCSDIDTRCVHMAYLQLGLAGIPAIVCHQDTLSLKTWDVWETPSYIMQWLRFRNALGSKKQNSPTIEQI